MILTSFDLSNPEQALRKAEILQRAATAPADPSSADLAVATQARMVVLRAKAEIRVRDSRKEYHTSRQNNDHQMGIKARERLLFCRSFQSRLNSKETDLTRVIDA